MLNNNYNIEDEDHAYVMISETINEIMEYMKQKGMLQQPDFKPPSRHTDAEMFKGMEIFQQQMQKTQRPCGPPESGDR